MWKTMVGVSSCFFPVLSEMSFTAKRYLLTTLYGRTPVGSVPAAERSGHLSVDEDSGGTQVQMGIPLRAILSVAYTVPGLRPGPTASADISPTTTPEDPTRTLHALLRHKCH